MNSSPLIGPVSRDLRGSILLVTIDNPPVNALSTEVRRGLLTAVEDARTNASVSAVVIVGSGKRFIAGADIRELGKPMQPPSMSDVCDQIENLDKLVVAAIDGAALGGGLEVALAAHYRVATASTRFAFPEVTLGLLPGAGGTQRAPRLIGAEAALDLMLSGRSVKAKEALAIGLIDKLFEGEDATAAGLAYAHELLVSGAMARRTGGANGLADRAASQVAVDNARKNATKGARGLSHPMRILDAVQASLDLPLHEGLKAERRFFVECATSSQCAGLIHAFQAERAVAKAPEARAAKPRRVDTVGVVGGGTMGAGITVAILDSGLPVIMIERDETSLARGRANVQKVYDTLIAKGRISEQDKASVMSRFRGSVSYDALADVDLVIEAIFEEMSVKKAAFAELDRVCKPGAVLATNTSFLNVDEIAESISRPADVIGLHFFSPANIMKLLEIVVPAAVSNDVVATAFELAKTLRKVPVRAGVCDGFIGNRILSVYRQAADHMMEDGASPYQIDEALRDFGYPMGPYQVSDLAGGDISWANRKRLAGTRNSALRYVQIGDRICEQGWFGQKTGRGYYLYPEGSRSGIPSPEVDAVIDAERKRAGITPRRFSDDEIVRRYLAAMINEGANVVYEGIALRPLDVDVTFIYGYGFPRYRGGPMKYADTVGLPAILADIQNFAKEDPVFWKPSPLLEELVAKGANFSSLNITE